MLALMWLPAGLGAQEMSGMPAMETPRGTAAERPPAESLRTVDQVKGYLTRVREGQIPDLSRLDLSGLDFRGVDFRKADLSGATLTGARRRVRLTDVLCARVISKIGTATARTYEGTKA
jgi:hypothetical protein